MFIDDRTGILSASDFANVKALASPLDVKVLVASTESRAALDARVHDLVTSANTLAIGVDPVHHYTFTHFGTGTGISGGDFQGVARAGNGEFHAGHWADGIRAIVNAANAATSEGQHGTVIVQEPVKVVEHPVAAWPFVVGGGAFVVLAVLLVSWLRRRQGKLDTAVERLDDEAQQLRSRNIEEQGWHDAFKAKAPVSAAPAPSAPATPPAPFNFGRVEYERRKLAAGPSRISDGRRSARSYAPAAVPIFVGQSSNDGFVTGMLLGEAMNRPTVVEREVIHETPRDSGYDGGLSSSSFDSSPSYDSGSSFDSGSSGGDFGGGGFDGGGGGGDF